MNTALQISDLRLISRIVWDHAAVAVERSALQSNVRAKRGIMMANRDHPR
jgi:hypothetical protein